MWVFVEVRVVFTCPSDDSEEEEEGDSLASCCVREEPSVALSMLLSSTMLRLQGNDNNRSHTGSRGPHQSTTT